jgi:urea transport system ATP-binding protein
MTATPIPAAITYPPYDGDQLLAVRELNVYYGESHILRNVDLSIAPGQMACLIGLNGVGKTTLLKTIMGLLRQRSGSILLAGQE